VESEEVIILASMCNVYKGVLPSQLMDITDPYTAYCFNETMLYIISRLEKGDKPIKEINKNKSEKFEEKHLSSFSQLYNKYDN
jgi:hypothetical protein